MPSGIAVARHLVFVLDTGEFVVQRAANLIETLDTHQRRVFSDYERDHAITDEELARLEKAHVIEGFDETTVWLPHATSPLRPLPGKARYYYLDTRLSPPYLGMVRSLMEITALDQHYMAIVRMDRVAIMDTHGDPFPSLTDADHALMLIKNTLGSRLPDVRIESLKIDTTLGETRILNPEYALIRETPVSELQDFSVLIVENDADLRDSYTLALENLMEVRPAEDGETALQIVMDEEPDLVLLDLNLPDMHGFEVIARLRKDPQTSHTPIIALSALHSEQDVVFALNVAKVDDYLVKPVSPTMLRRRVISLLSRA